MQLSVVCCSLLQQQQQQTSSMCSSTSDSSLSTLSNTSSSATPSPDDTYTVHEVASQDGSDSELAAIVRTLRYHYLLKVYIPLYRLLKLQSRRNDREEIRRRLAMATSEEEYYGSERAFRKPNLQTRLQSGMNLQICYVNQTPPTSEEEPSAPAREDKKVTSKVSHPLFNLVASIYPSTRFAIIKNAP